MSIVVRTDLNKQVLASVFEGRGWRIELGGEEAAQQQAADPWHLWWCSVSSVKHIFASGAKLQPHQRVSHFPNYYELTRKDLLVKNLKRYAAAARKEGGNGGGAPPPDILPTTYVLPAEHAMFADDFRRSSGGGTWIMKPQAGAQGRGIFLINQLAQVQRWNPRSGPPAAALLQGARPRALRPQVDPYIVSRYIERPLLISGKKFDLRLFVLVAGYRPLVAYLSRLGFARFTNVRYTSEVAEIDNAQVHLTNVAVQKEGPGYNGAHGNKWLLEDLRLHLEAVRGHAATAQLWAEMRGLVVHALRAVAPAMINDRHCFELYGFDLLVDSDLKPWLIEVNASPSLSTTTAADRHLKTRVVADALQLVAPRQWEAAAARAAAAGAGAAGAAGEEAAGGWAGGGPAAPSPTNSFEVVADDRPRPQPDKQPDKQQQPAWARSPGKASPSQRAAAGQRQVQQQQPQQQQPQHRLAASEARQQAPGVSRAGSVAPSAM